MFRPRIEFVLAGLAGDHCARRLHGGDSSSSSTTKTDTTNIDKRQVVNTGGVGVSSDQSTVYTTYQTLDAGAIAQGSALASKALTEMQGALSAVVGANAIAGQSLDNVLGLAGQSLDKVLGLAGDVFTGGIDIVKGGMGLVTTAQSQASAAMGVLASAKSDVGGAIDQKTIVVLALAGAAVAAIAFTERRK